MDNIEIIDSTDFNPIIQNKNSKKLFDRCYI